MLRALAAAFCAATVGLAPAAAADPLVRTDSGVLRGKTEPGLEVFLGVPYAEPPVGALRWREPKPMAPWRGVRPATRFSPGCVQEPPVPFGPYSAEFVAFPDMSEDCLDLNVWAPAPSRVRRPVLVFIHGGAFQIGATAVPIYDGADLARKGVVVVTINYRLGVFGFLAHPELSKESSLGSSGNYGLLDMVAALRWVQSNIARFGGDPRDVTIAGQSAGAIAVDDLLASPAAKGLFQRAIAESGPTLGVRMKPLEVAERGGIAFVGRANPPTISQLRAMPAEDVQALFRGPGKVPSPPFAPLPLLDGKVVISDPEVPTSPIVSKPPLLVGFNRDEATVTPTATAAQFIAHVKQQYGAFADRVLADYPHATDEQAGRSATELARDRQIAGLMDWAARRASTSGERVFVYLFDHPYPGHDARRWKTFHTAEVPFVFGTLNAVTPTASDRAVSRQLQARWLAFMKRGDPSLPGGRWADISHAPGQVMMLGDRVGEAPPMSAERLALFHAYLAEAAAP